MARGSGFNGRGLVSLLVAGGFLVMAVTGAVLFVVPPGRIAHWTDWALLGLSKDQWGAVHTAASVLFVTCGVWHLVNNWKPFLHHLRRRIAGAARPRREGAVAALVLALLVTGALADVPPVSWVLDLNERARAMWTPPPEARPPFGHAEEVSLRALALRTGRDPGAMVAALTAAGLRVADGPRTTLRAVADGNAMTPAGVYAVIQAALPPDPAAARGGRR